MRKKLILLITTLLLLMVFSVPASALGPLTEVENVTNIRFKFDKNVIMDDGSSQVINGAFYDGLIPYEYKLVNKEVKSSNLPTPYRLGVRKEGHSFAGWKIHFDMDNLISQSPSLSVFNVIGSPVRETNAIAEAQWKKNNLEVSYKVNYGTVIENPNFEVNKDGFIINKKDNSLFTQGFTYETKKEAGLVNAKTFNLEKEGYTFVGWSTTKNGVTLLNEDKALSAEDISKKVLTSDAKVVLYAQWMPETVSILYSLNDDTETVTSKYYTTEGNNIKEIGTNVLYSQKYSYPQTKNLKLNNNSFGLSKPFAELCGWSSSPNGSGKVFRLDEKITYKDILPLLTEDGKILRLYPVWKCYTFPLDDKDSIYISSLQGHRIHPVYNTPKYHAGLDIAAYYGMGILATEDGVVTEVGIDAGFGYGNYVKINHGNGIETLYAHASKTLVKVGDKVKQGDMIARVGSTGTSTGNHLHLEIRIDGIPQDPMKYIDFTGIPVNE